MCTLSDLLNAVLKLIHAIKNRNINANLDSTEILLSFLNNKFIVNIPVIKINSNALVDLASPEKKGVG